MIRLRWMNALEHNYRLSLKLVEQKKFRDLETNAFPIDVEPMLINHWKNAEDGGAALRQNWDNIQC